jgi:hypothetical protein
MTEPAQARTASGIVLAHAGGLDTTVAIPWLAETYRAEIIAVTVDLGQKKEWLEEARDRALASGAVRAHCRRRRATSSPRDYLSRGLRVGLFHDDPTATIETLARPLIAQTLVSIAGIEQSRAVAHGDRGGTGGASLANGGARPRSRADDAGGAGVDVAAARRAIVDDRAVPEERIACRSGTAASWPAEPALVDVALHRGAPTGINGVSMAWSDLVGEPRHPDAGTRRRHVGARSRSTSPTMRSETATISADAERFGADGGQGIPADARDGSVVLADAAGARCLCRQDTRSAVSASYPGREAAQGGLHVPSNARMGRTGSARRSSLSAGRCAPLPTEGWRR